jgi:hypothetical protein
MLPPAPLREEVNFYLILEAEALGVSVDSLTTDQIQLIAYSLRVKDRIESDPTDPEQDLEIARALDNLSDLEPSDVQYLEDLSGRVSSTQ